MTQIKFVAYLLCNFLSVIIITLLFLSVVVVAERISWYLLLVYIPIGWYTYQTELVSYRNKKPAVVKKKSF